MITFDFVCLRVLLGDVEHATKVTALKGGWGIRVFTNGELNSQAFVTEKSQIGMAIRQLLRLEDKCGNYSSLAHNSRMRPGRKAAQRSLNPNTSPS